MKCEIKIKAVTSVNGVVVRDNSKFSHKLSTCLVDKFLQECSSSHSPVDNLWITRPIHAFSKICQHAWLVLLKVTLGAT